MIAVQPFNRRHVGGVEPYSDQDLRQRNLRKERRLQRGGGDGGSPTQHATIVVVFSSRTAWPFACLSAESGSDGAGRQTRSTIDGMVMMQNRDGELHAESNQRQPNQSKTVSRYCHFAPAACPGGHESSDLMSPSWRPLPKRGSPLSMIKCGERAFSHRCTREETAATEQNGIACAYS